MRPDDPDDDFRNQDVLDLIAASGRTQDEVAAYLSRRLGRAIRGYYISRLTRRRRIPSEEMDALRELAGQPAAASPVAPNLTETADVVPLFGYANAAGGVLRISEDQRVGVVPIHPAQLGSRSAFAFIVFGDSVSPRLNHGEIGYAIRNRPPFPNQLAVIEQMDGTAIVKFYIRQDERTLFLRQLKGEPKDFSIPLKDVQAIHAVVGSTFGPA